jgi:hypothetical protein
MEQISLPRRAKRYEHRAKYIWRLLMGTYSWQNVPHHPVYVRLFRQHVPGDNRH